MEWLYINSDDNSSRYVLGTKGQHPLFCFGINPSTAEPNALDATLRNVQNIALNNGYDSWIMFNIYPKRDTIFENLHFTANDEEHKKNIEHILNTLKQYETADIWVAFGDHIYDRDYLPVCLKDIYLKLIDLNINWYTTKINKSGAPKHPLYQKKTSKLFAFDMENYIKSI